MSKDKVIHYIKENQYDKAFKQLYRYYPKFASWAKKQGNKSVAADDIFQDALVVVYDKLSDPSFKLTSSCETYLFSVCKYMYFDQCRKEAKAPKTEFPEEFEMDDLEDSLKKENQLQAVEQILEKLGKKCLQIIQAFYVEAMKMKEIAKKFGYSSEKSAKVQKYKCMERARKEMMNVELLNGAE